MLFSNHSKSSFWVYQL